MKHEIIIADTSCLIVLQRIGEMELLQKLFEKITITEDVRNEFGQPLPNWIFVKKVKDLGQKRMLEVILDKGEASSIAFCLEQKTDALLIIDEKKGEKWQSN
jgi:predicted nucleic acid-binding protein